jgi:hypothetical protein
MNPFKFSLDDEFKNKKVYLTISYLVLVILYGFFAIIFNKLELFLGLSAMVMGEVSCISI